MEDHTQGWRSAIADVIAGSASLSSRTLVPVAFPKTFDSTGTGGLRLVPHSRRLVVAAGGEQTPVRAERHPPDRSGVAGQGAQVLAGAGPA